MKNYKINIIFYNTSTHFIVLYPNRTQRHLKNPYKAHKYKLCRDLPFYSNSGADEIILAFSSTHLCCFVFIFSAFHLMFFSHQIIRAKIEPYKTIFSALIAPILIAHPVV